LCNPTRNSVRVTFFFSIFSKKKRKFGLNPPEFYTQLQKFEAVLKNPKVCLPQIDGHMFTFT
jgi:hypothetical protein